MKKTNNRRSKYRQINQFDRDRIQALLDTKVEQKEVARILGRHPSTISREIQRNRRKQRKRGGTRDGPYEATVAEHKAYVRRKYAKYQGKKIWENNELKKYIVSGLKKHWSPDDISGRMKKENKPYYISKTAIYEWLYTANGQRWCHLLSSEQCYPKKRIQNKQKRYMIPNRISIEQRSITINKEYGHYEGDTVVSGKKTHSTAALAVLVERRAKYVDIRKIRSLRPQQFTNAVINMQNNLSERKSLTLDNGLENRYHEQMRIDTYFCDTYSSWQKGRVENMISLIRRYVLKGSDINNYSENYIKKVVSILNNKPRKSLNYQTPYEIMVENNLFIKKNPVGEIALGG